MIETQFHIDVRKCHRCDKRKSVGGSVVCGMDDRTFNAHALALYCPHPDGPRFGTAQVPDGWEDVAKWLPLPMQIDRDYEPTPKNATEGRCCS
jgi:hypothetical protein